MRISRLLFEIFYVCLISLVNSLHQNGDIAEVLQSKDILETTFFRFNFSTSKLLEVDTKYEKLGIEYCGELTNERLQEIFEKASQGQNVTLLVLGGSSTIGADLGAGSKTQTYHMAFSSWWNENIFPVTGSFLHKKVIAIGGVGSAYMSYCWKIYLDNKKAFDIVFWEFFMNDFYFDDYSRILDNFFKSILQYSTSTPAFILVKFSPNTIFQGEQLTCLVTSEFFNAKDKVVRQKSRQYQISVASMQEIICRNVQQYNRILLKKDYFVHIHPSHKAHAQIGFTLINYIRNIFITFLKSPNRTRQYKHFPSSQSENNAQCFTGLLPFANALRKTIYDIPLLWSRGYRRRSKCKWDQSIAERTDIRGGYVAKEAQSEIIFQLPLNIVYKVSNVYLVISHQSSPNSFYIDVIVRSIYGDFASSLDCSQLLHPATSVQRIASNVLGTCNIEVYDPTGKCLINAIVLEEDDLTSTRNKV
ncbi:uncharacterized protein [Clytia hemisphaerica]